MSLPKFRIIVARPPEPPLLTLREELDRIRDKYHGLPATRRNLAARREEIDLAYRRDETRDS